MSTLTYNQLKQLWIANGGSPTWAPVAAGIALAESGGDTSALNNNPNTGDYSVGLWQINYFDGLLQSRTASYGSPSALQADPNAQARAAISLSGNGRTWQPWVGDTVGNYVQGNGAGPLSDAQVMGILQAAGDATGGGVGSYGVLPANLESGATAGVPATSLTFTFRRSTGCRSDVYAINASPLHLLSECQAQAIAGVGLMIGGALVLVIGAALLIAGGLNRTGALSALQAAPGPVGAAAKVASGPRGAARAYSGRKQRQAGEETRQRRREESIADAETRANARRYGAGAGSRSTPGPAAGPRSTARHRPRRRPHPEDSSPARTVVDEQGVTF